MRRIRIFLLVTLVVSSVSGIALRALMPEKKIDESIFLREVAREADFEAKGGTPPHYTSPRGTVAFNTYDVTPEIRGYAGPIKLLIALERNGNLSGIKILEHKETPNYVRGMESEGFLKQFVGKSINDPFEPDKDIDGVSRATVSVEALTLTVRESSRKIAHDAMGMEVSGGEGRRSFSLKWAAYAALFALSMAGYFITRRNKNLLRVRDLSLLSGIAVTGLWLSGPFSILHALNLLLLRPSSDMLWFLIVSSFFLSVILAGRFYCGWLCPFGALSEFIGRLPIKKWEISIEADDRFRKIKYFLLALLMALVLTTGRVDYGNYETYVTLFSFHGSFLSWVLVVICLIAGLKAERFWCRFLCPVAALSGLLSKKDDRYVSRDDCPMANKPMPLISECIRCNRCYKL